MRISFNKPTDESIRHFIEKESLLELTYQPIGGTKSSEPVHGHDNDYQCVKVGHGLPDFEKAKEALKQWKHFPGDWTAILPAQTPIWEGQNLAMFFRLFGFWWRNSCRIVYVRDEARHFAFAYGTLPGHIESGEEVFGVFIDAQDDVYYELSAFSKPRTWFVRLGYPMARLLQEKFRKDSALDVEAYISGIAAPKFSPNRWVVHLLVFMAIGWLLWPGSFMGHDFGKLPLVFAFLVMTPLVLLTVSTYFSKKEWDIEPLSHYLLPAGVLAAFSLHLEAGISATILATPWLLVCLAVSWLGRKANWVAMAGALYLSVGGAWLWADRAGIRPMGFGDDIVRLTALHFHYAGFALPLVSAILLRQLPGILSRLAGWGVVVGVPLTAVGITATQMHLGPVPETLAAVVMSLSGFITGLLLLRLAWIKRSWVMGMAGATLLFTMSLSLGYGLRVYWPQFALDLDNMRAIHGALNGLVALPLAFWGLWYYGKIKKIT